jgi:hypothetical protein
MLQDVKPNSWGLNSKTTIMKKCEYNEWGMHKWLCLATWSSSSNK